MTDIKQLVNEKGQIAYESLASKAATIIRYKIISGEFSHGQKIRELDLSNMLGISRLSIREAFIQLEKEGLLIKEQNRYTKVVDFTEKDVKEIYSLRAAVETLCAGIAVANQAVPEAQMRRIITELDQIYGTKPVDRIAWLDNDLEFHGTIVQASGHTKAIEIWNNLKNQIKTLLFPVITETPIIMHSSTDERHMKLLEVMLEGDVETLEKLLSMHINSGAELVIDYLRKKHAS
jgi:DNA-binding GntR family transcriptional regulator